MSFILTGYAGFSSSAGYVGPYVRVDHDISLLIPEIWARIEPEERDPDYLIKHGYLEPLEDFDHQGERVLASRLGYRITEHFVHGFLGKIFDNPHAVFTEEILKPEVQDLDVFVDGINNIVEAQQRVAQRYIDDGSFEDACPPLQALLHIMANGEYQDMDAHSPAFRAMFTRDNLLQSSWYRERLQIKQLRDIALWQQNIANLQQFLDDTDYADEAEHLGIRERLQRARQRLVQVESKDYLKGLVGTLGADPLGPSAFAADSPLWSKAKQSLGIAHATDPAHPQQVASLLQRFKERFRKTRLQ